jgi:hypothetical protein
MSACWPTILNSVLRMVPTIWKKNLRLHPRPNHRFQPQLRRQLQRQLQRQLRRQHERQLQPQLRRQHERRYPHHLYQHHLYQHQNLRLHPRLNHRFQPQLHHQHERQYQHHLHFLNHPSLAASLARILLLPLILVHSISVPLTRTPMSTATSTMAVVLRAAAVAVWENT